MNAWLQQLAEHPLTEIVGWTLMHFLWQGLLVAVILAGLLACLRGASASARYWVACVGLALLAMAPLVTAVYLTINYAESGVWQTADQNRIKSIEFTNDMAAQGDAGEFLAMLPLADDPAANDPSALPGASFITETSSGTPLREWLRDRFPFFVAFWLIGVLLLSLRLLGGLWRVSQWRRSGLALESIELKQMVAKLSTKMSLQKRFKLLASAQATVPAVIGWLKPAVIVPTSLISGLTPAELESLLAHELAHIQRHDFLVNLLQTVIETLLFYHPAVWWLSRIIRQERENCCDDLAVAACGNRIIFARALAKLEELRCGEPKLALSARGGSLLGRVERLLVPATSHRNPIGWPAGALVFGSIALMLSSLFLAAAIAKSESAGVLIEAPITTEFGSQDEPQAETTESETIPLKIVEKDDDVIKRIELLAPTQGRSPKELWRKWNAVREVGRGPGVSVTDAETLVSATQNARWIGNGVDAAEIIFSLPEGSAMRAEFFGDRVEIVENGNHNSVIVTKGKVRLIDQGGVVRAWASADSGAEQVVANVSLENQEFVMRLKAKRLVDDPQHMPQMQCATFPETGAPKDEDQSPHGAVRYEVHGDAENRTFRLKILWRYDVDRIRQEAEPTAEIPASSSAGSKSILSESSSLKPRVADHTDLVSKAKQLGDFLQDARIRFDSAGYMRLAADLMALNEPRRLGTLQAMAEARLEGQTIVLCRILFEAKPGTVFRRPGLSEPKLVGTSTEEKDWPLEPVTLVGEVPLRIVEGYRLGGQMEPAKQYLEYCLTNCNWTTRAFSEIDKALAAADQAIRQPAFWGGAIDEEEWREWAGLRLQLKPSLIIEVKQQHWVNIVTPLYSVLGEGTWKVAEAIEKVTASKLPKDAPATMIISDSAKPEWIEPLVRELAAAGYRNQQHIWWQKSHEPVQRPELQKLLTEASSETLGKEATEWGPVEAQSGLQLRLTLNKPSVPAGERVLGKLELRNSGKQATAYDPQNFAPFRVVLIADKDGKPVSFIGPRPQTSGSAQELAPGKMVTLWEDVDLGELYLLDSGDYEVAVVLNDRQRNRVLESAPLRLKVAEGRLPANLLLLKQLREIAPADWAVSTSFGAIYLSHSPTNLKSDVTTIQLWFTEEPLPADYKLGEGKDQQPVTTVAQTELGFLHLAAPSRANDLWPEHVLLIKIAAARVLSFNGKPDVRSKDAPATDEDSKDQAKALPWRANGRVTDREGNLWPA